MAGPANVRGYCSLSCSYWRIKLMQALLPIRAMLPKRRLRWSGTLCSSPLQVSRCSQFDPNFSWRVSGLGVAKRWALRDVETDHVFPIEKRYETETVLRDNKTTYSIALFGGV